jgi:hypothetical protein
MATSKVPTKRNPLSLFYLGQIECVVTFSRMAIQPRRWILGPACSRRGAGHPSWPLTAGKSTTPNPCCVLTRHRAIRLCERRPLKHNVADPAVLPPRFADRVTPGFVGELSLLTTGSVCLFGSPNNRNGPPSSYELNQKSSLRGRSIIFVTQPTTSYAKLFLCNPIHVN